MSGRARRSFYAIKRAIRQGYGVEDIAIRRGISEDVVRDVVAYMRKTKDLRLDPPTRVGRPGR